MEDLKNTFDILNSEHKDLIAQAFKKSSEIYMKLEEYYTDEKLKTFKTFDDFLEDINYLLETDSIAKPNFVKMVAKKFLIGF